MRSGSTAKSQTLKGHWREQSLSPQVGTACKEHWLASWAPETQTLCLVLGVVPAVGGKEGARAQGEASWFWSKRQRARGVGQTDRQEGKWTACYYGEEGSEKQEMEKGPPAPFLSRCPHPQWLAAGLS